MKTVCRVKVRAVAIREPIGLAVPWVTTERSLLCHDV